MGRDNVLVTPELTANRRAGLQERRSRKHDALTDYEAIVNTAQCASQPIRRNAASLQVGLHCLQAQQSTHA